MTVTVRIEVSDSEDFKSLAKRIELAAGPVERNDIFRMMLNMNTGRTGREEKDIEYYRNLVNGLMKVAEQLEEIDRRIDVEKAMTHLRVIP